MIKGIKFVNVPVADQTRALEFYTAKLGFTVATNQPMGAAPTFRVDLVQTFRGKQWTIMAPACTSSKLSFATKQDDFMLPDFEFSAFDDGTGNVFTQTANGY